MAGIIIVGTLVLIAVLAPVIAPYDPVKQDLVNALADPSSAHLLGTDKYGRDVLSRLIWGAQVDLRVGFLAVLIPFVIGTVVGAIAGYFGGWLDTVLMRIVDIFFAFPFYVMVIVLVFIFGSGEFSIYIAIAAVSWVAYAKIVRGEVLVAKQQDYVGAARLGGMSHARVLVRHIGPNVLSQAIIYAMTTRVPTMMMPAMRDPLRYQGRSDREDAERRRISRAASAAAGRRCTPVIGDGLLMRGLSG